MNAGEPVRMPDKDEEGLGDKRSTEELCRYWETRLLEVARGMSRTEETTDRSVVIAAALFLGELAEKVTE